jgi:hypothetical protein
VSSVYGTGVSVDQPFSPTREVKRAEILVSTPGSTGPFVSTVRTPTCCDPTTLKYALVDGEGHLVPNTEFSFQWRVTDADGTVHLSEPTSALYKDSRFDWKTVTGPIVRVHWYKGSTDFGRRARDIGEKGIAEAARILGVTETEPVDFFIYADEEAFYDALGPGTRENVGGEAHADIRTLFALIPPDDIDATWVSTVIPHELTHLVFDTAVKNPYHFPPRWLNEGIAVYLSEGYDDSYRADVKDAVRGDAIIPLDGLASQFPTTRDQFFLAYGESVSAVDYLVRTFGRDALVKLVRSYVDGVTDDEAFKAGIGRDVATFQAGWLDDLGAKTPTAVGPQAGPVGPLPPGWTGPPDRPIAQPRPSAAPGGADAAPKPPLGDESTGIGFLVTLAVVIVVGLVLVGRRRSRRSRQGVEPLDPEPPDSGPPGWIQP